MELFQEIMCKEIGKMMIEACYDLPIDYKEIINLKSLQALKKIKTIISDDGLSDPECFMRMDEIICLFETLGSSGGNRHDFGQGIQVESSGSF